MSDYSACFWSVASVAVSLRSHHHHRHHISGAIELLTFGMFQQFCVESTELWVQVSAQVTAFPFPHSSSPIPCSTHAPSSPVSHPPSRWVTALSASGERGETERVQSHLLFYRQPAFSPRDLIITRPAERIAHEALSHTMIRTRKQDCMLLDKNAGICC